MRFGGETSYHAGRIDWFQVVEGCNVSCIVSVSSGLMESNCEAKNSTICVSNSLNLGFQHIT
jgi:hypothetical protein